MGSPEPAAFLSYVRADDRLEDGLISQFRERLSAEVRMQIAQDFPIFQDHSDIVWGQDWHKRINETLDVVTLLISVMTPGFFASKSCRDEVSRFLERERQLGRNDLILPVYYVGAPQLDDPTLRKNDSLATTLFARQYADWRELRFEPFTAPVVRKALAQLATRMRETFWRPPPSEGQREQGDTAQPKTGAVEAPQAKTDRSSVVKHEPPTHGLGMLEDNEITGNGYSGVSITTWGNPTLRHNRIHGGKAGGVSVYDSGLGTLEDNEITENSYSGMAITTGGNPTLRRNRINRNGHEAVWVHEGGGGVIEDNDLSGNARGAWDIAKGSEDKVSRLRNKEN